MRFSSKIILLFAFILSISCADNETAEKPKEENTELLHVQGSQIVDKDNNPVYLQGVAFGNDIWSNPTNPSNTHHDETDYQRVQDMGMNAIRFYINYGLFEDDTNPYQYKQSGWDWLDKNIIWAKKHNIYLIVNMHYPQGGYQSGGNGDALWTNLENQNRLASLWQAIAERYKDESQIGGFGIVNEPVPTASLTQWSQLAQNVIDEIRKVNKNHLLFIERAIYVKNDEASYQNLNIPIVNGDNLVYEFHGYDPYKYTHQLLAFAEMGEGGTYPDENTIETTNTTWYTATFNNPSLNSGSSNWSYFEGENYKITDTEIKMGGPALVGALVEGKVYFDDIIVKEFDEAGNFVRNVLEVNLNTIENWYYWSGNASGNSGLSSNTGHNDSSSLFIENATGDCNLNNSNLNFLVKPNYSYKISGWMKGENVSTDAACKIRLDFYKAEGAILTRNKAYLESVFKRYTDWANTNNVPLFMGEFGAGSPCFENGKGGLQFVEDMVSIAKANNVHFTYHAYHEDAFGIYKGFGALPNPNNANTLLIELFKKLLKN